MGNCLPVVSAKGADLSSPSFSLLLICNIWNKESHGLFDYESKNSAKIAIKITGPGGLLKNKKTLTFCREDNLPKPGEEINNKVLLSIHCNSSGYFIDSKAFQVASKSHLGLGENSVWQVIKSSKDLQQSSMGYKLSVGDFIKLGRVRFRVRSFKGNSTSDHKDHKEEILTQGDAIEDFINVHKKKESIDLTICNNTNNNNNNNNSNKTGNLNIDVLNSSSNLNLACRICLERTDTDEDPLLTPCKCAGTMKFIHLQCLQKWLRGRTVIKQNSVSTTIIYKSLSCELCKTVFPEFLTGNGGKKYPTLEMQLPQNNYIVLEILNRDSNILKGLHIVDMKTKQNIRIGRAHDSDLRFSDISVSRTHAIIHFSNGGFYLEDNKSKFGTLVLLRNPINLKRINPRNFALQIESTNISFQNLVFSKSNSSCCGFKINNENIDNMDTLKTREIITLPDTNRQQHPVLHDLGDMNSHDLAINLDNHPNNSILIHDEVIAPPNQQNLGIANMPLVLANGNELQDLEEHQLVNNGPDINPEFNFDSENEYSIEFGEGNHNIPLQDVQIN